MDLTNLPIMNAMKQRMRWLTARQGVIAENLANADTPGYTPKRLKPQNFQDLMAKVERTGASRSLKKTNGQHMNAGGTTNAQRQVAKADEVSDARPNGNGVVLEDELISLAQTQIEYQTMLSTYRKQSSILKMALGRGTQ